MNYPRISLVPLSIIAGILFMLSGCANPGPSEADPVNLPSLGMDMVRIAVEGGVLF